MVTSIQKWGNSLAIRIPKAFAAQANLSEDASVHISIEGDRIIVAPLRRVWTLEDLLKQIKRANTHGEISWGDPSGNEVW